MVIPGRITIFLVKASIGSYGNNARIPYSEGSLPPRHIFLKFKCENAIIMKNNPDLGPLETSYLFKEKKWH
jgi:hypothetical protein